MADVWSFVTARYSNPTNVIKTAVSRDFGRSPIAKGSLGLLLALLTIPALQSRGEDAPTTPPLTQAPALATNFSLLDYSGRYYELRRADAKVVVLFFTGADCPIARQSTPKLRAIEDQFAGKGVLVWMINATPKNDPDETRLDMMYALGRFAPRDQLGDRYAVNQIRNLVAPSVLGDRETIRQETLEFVWGVPPLPPVLRDEHQLVSRSLGVTRTCETLAIDTRDLSIIYRGAIDDQFVEGAKKPKTEKKYLRSALTEFLADKPISTPKTAAHGCAITFDGLVDRQISYSREIAPLLQRKCAGCHSPGGIGPFAMSSHKKVSGWSAMMRETVLERRMPPWHADPHHGKFANDNSLTGDEARTLLQWIEQGSPRGDGADPLAAAMTDAPAWQLGQPDYIIKIPEQKIPATGAVDYRYLEGDLEMPRDAWLRAAVTRPGSPKVVHHIIVRVRYPASYKQRPSEAYLFTTWVPGLLPAECPKDTGVFLPKGSRFNFEVHYTPDGRPRTDQSEVGLYLAKARPPMQLETRGAETRVLDIPAGDPNAQHSSTYCFRRDTMLYGLSPHMHVRGSWFKFQLLYPDGRRELLLSVPHYDFNWQTSYRLAEPMRVPAGSWLLCTGGFDNSAKNPSNPDPRKRVEWGPQSWNEMFMGFVDVADAPLAAAAGRAEPAAESDESAAKQPR